MKKRILLILTLFLSLVALGSLRAQIEMDEAKNYISFYIPDMDGNWKMIRSDIPAKTEGEYLEKTMQYLLEGAANNKFPAVFPYYVDYYSIAMQGNKNLEINFKSGYLRMPDLQRGLCQAALIKTFMGFPEVEGIYLYQEGIPLSLISQLSSWGLSEKGAFINIEENLTEITAEKELLYFYDEGKRKLVGVERKVSRPAYVSREKSLLTELQVSPELEGLTALLKPNIKINDVRARNQVCYVDFGQEFVKEYSEMGIKKQLLIYSIVNTLTNLEEVEYVQFLINGENPEIYVETDSLKGLFRKNHVYIDYS